MGWLTWDAWSAASKGFGHAVLYPVINAAVTRRMALGVALAAVRGSGCPPHLGYPPSYWFAGNHRSLGGSGKYSGGIGKPPKGKRTTLLIVDTGIL
jgi:hypothetical protein